jgi:biotin transporter BioY
MSDAASLPSDFSGPVTKVIGFFDESVGVKSSSRLIVAVLIGVVILLALTIVGLVVYSLPHDKKIDPEVIIAIGGVMVPIATTAVMVHKNRDSHPTP